MRESVGRVDAHAVVEGEDSIAEEVARPIAARRTSSDEFGPTNQYVDLIAGDKIELLKDARRYHCADLGAAFE